MSFGISSFMKVSYLTKITEFFVHKELDNR